MIELIYSPSWFYGRDIAIDILSMIVIGLLMFFGLRAYILTKKKNYATLTTSFFLIFISFLAKVLMNFTIYNEILETRMIGFASFTYERILSSDNLYFVGFLIYRIFFLIGLYLLYSIYHKQNAGNIFFVSCLIFVSMLYSNGSYFIFYSLSFLLLSLITIQYFRNYNENHNKMTRLLAVSFLLITISQLLSIFIKSSNLFYVIGEIVQLVGFFMLLMTYITVLKHGKKKNEE